MALADIFNIASELDWTDASTLKPDGGAAMENEQISNMFKHAGCPEKEPRATTIKIPWV